MYAFATVTSRFKILSGKKALQFVIIASLATLGAYAYQRASEPTDVAMRRTFRQHRDSLDALRQLILADATLEQIGLDRVGRFWFVMAAWSA